MILKRRFGVPKWICQWSAHKSKIAQLETDNEGRYFKNLSGRLGHEMLVLISRILRREAVYRNGISCIGS
jgi:hypothetical protein